jgi:hypothetical protein
MKRDEVIMLVLAAVATCFFITMRRQLLEERLARFNAEAAADTSRIVAVRANGARVSERRAFQEDRIQLQGDLARVLRAKNEQTQLLARVQIQLDSLAGVVSTGTVSSGADTSLRLLASSIDTAGWHLSIDAEVPRPPALARVTWRVRHDSIELAAALNRGPDGRESLRVMTGAGATARIDSIRVQTSAKLRQTQRLAIPAGLLFVGYVLGRVFR